MIFPKVIYHNYSTNLLICDWILIQVELHVHLDGALNHSTAWELLKYFIIVIEINI